MGSARRCCGIADICELNWIESNRIESFEEIKLVLRYRIDGYCV